MNPTNEELKLRIKKSSHFRVGFVCLIAAALIFEAVSWKLGCITPNLEMLIALAIALGVIGEEVASHIGGNASDELLRRSEKRVRDLEELTAPRVLTPEQVERIGKALRQFAGTEYVGVVNMPAKEIMDLMEGIEAALWRAGWKENDCPWTGIQRRPGKTILCTATVDNVTVRVHPGSGAPPKEHWAKLIEAGQALADALTAADIKTTLEVKQVEQLGAPTSASIHVMIGPKT